MANRGDFAIGGVRIGPSIMFGESQFCMNENNNFYGDCDMFTSRTLCTIANVGKVNGLGSITKIPNSGYAVQASVEVGHGYVIKASDGTYARLYVVDWITYSGSGGIAGAKVKYQYPFEP